MKRRAGTPVKIYEQSLLMQVLAEIVTKRVNNTDDIVQTPDLLVGPDLLLPSNFTSGQPCSRQRPPHLTCNGTMHVEKSLGSMLSTGSSVVALCFFPAFFVCEPGFNKFMNNKTLEKMRKKLQVPHGTMCLGFPTPFSAEVQIGKSNKTRDGTTAKRGRRV